MFPDSLGLSTMGVDIENGLDDTNRLPILCPEVRRSEVSGSDRFPRERALVCDQ